MTVAPPPSHSPAVSMPELARIRRNLASKDLFIVAQDIFPTETTALADVVLPAAQWAEKTGCGTNVDRTVHLSHQAIKPPGEAWSDMKIFSEFSRRMDFKNKDGEPLIPWTDDAEAAFEHWKHTSKVRSAFAFCCCSATSEADEGTDPAGPPRRLQRHELRE